MNQVHLEQLVLRDYRNLERLDLEPHPRFNIVSGLNGMGKTNLLEAIYMLGSLKSFRTTARAELIRHGAEAATVRGTFGGDALGLVCEIGVSRGERRVRVAGKPVAPGGEHFRTLPMVLFHPANMALVQAGPEHRRRFMDRALFQASPGYPQLFREYNRALHSRNRLLKQTPIDRSSLDPYDQQLARLAERLVRIRGEFLEEIAPFFVEAFESVSGGLVASLDYRPSVEGDEGEIAERLERALGRDGERGFTSVGPHADDIAIEVEGRSARRFASQGRQRAAVLALKIAETRAVAAGTGRVPLLLLDDVSSELDRQSNRQLFEFLDGVGGQVFITTTHLDHIPIESRRRDFRVDQGVVEPA